MPPAVLADSDDDGDELFLEPDVPASPAPGNDGSLALPALDGATEQSTGSTQRLRNQIRSAERGLFANSDTPNQIAVTGASGVPSLVSPSTHANKRRHTAVSVSQAAISPEKRVKRTKTLKTYSAKRSSAIVAHDEGAFAGLREDGQAPSTSQSARFTEHSGAKPSSGLPTGSVEVLFVDHEPNVMFRDTGSTAVDNESSQQRMIEHALHGRQVPSTSVSKLAESDELKSSSFPWSASEQTQSTKKVAPAQGTQSPTKEAQPGSEGVPAMQHSQAQPSGTHQDRTQPPQHPLEDKHRPAATREKSWKEIFEATGLNLGASKEETTPKHQSSPRVEIAVEAVDAETPVAPAPTSMQQTTKGRKRKAQNDSTDLPNSDEIAVGLPEERYVPRPSRRRATQMPEEPIDFSVRPEKAAKIKRTKTTVAATKDYSLETREELDTDVTFSDMACSKAASRNPAELAKQTCGDHESHHQSNSAEVQKLQEPPQHVVDEPKSVPVREEELVKPTGTNVKPTPKPKSTAKAKRSHTTIFEDHVEFTGSQRTPSLSQQQANRKLVLEGVKNEATEPPKKKRRKVVDSDEEDELALDASGGGLEKAEELVGQLEQEPEEPPKKRGRGRPPKATTSTKAKSVERVLEDSEAEPDDEPEQDSVDPPKAGRRGRKPKAAAVAQPNAKSQPTSNEAHAGDLEEQKTVSDKVSGDSAAPAAVASPVKSKTPAEQGPTPSPEKQTAGKGAITPPKTATKAGATSHSPIKSASKVPLRVGLSKRQRIAPLLRLVKPAKR